MKGGLSLIKAAVFVERELLKEVISHLYTDNRLIMKIALDTGLRIGDILEIRIGDVRNNRRFRIVEHKTGKVKYVRIASAVRKEILETRTYCKEDGYYCFPHRISPVTRHRTRSAVNKDIKRVLDIMGIEPRISPHSARKGYAVELYAKTGDLHAVQEALNHGSINTTVLYALSDKMNSARDKCRE